MKEKTKIIWLIIAGLICGTILWVFTSSLKKDDSPIMEGASIEEYEQQMFEEIPEEEEEEKEPPKKEESPIDFNNYKPVQIIVYQHGSVCIDQYGQVFIK